MTIASSSSSSSPSFFFVSFVNEFIFISLFIFPFGWHTHAHLFICWGCRIDVFCACFTTAPCSDLTLRFCCVMYIHNSGSSPCMAYLSARMLFFWSLLLQFFILILCSAAAFTFIVAKYPWTFLHNFFPLRYESRCCFFFITHLWIKSITYGSKSNTFCK